MTLRSMRDERSSRVDRDEGRRFVPRLEGDLRQRQSRFETLEGRLMLSGVSVTSQRECLTALLGSAEPGPVMADATSPPAALGQVATVLRTALGSSESTALPAVASVFATTALDAYVAAPDASFGWTFANSFSGAGYLGVVLQVTSQEWRTPAEVDRTPWKHWLTLIVPDTITHDTAFLAIVGGNNNSSAPTSADPALVQLAVATGTIVAELRMVPNQPLAFAGDGDGGVETAGTFIVPGQPGEQVELTFRFEEDNGGYQSKFGFYDASSVSADPVLEKRDFAIQAVSNGTLIFDDAVVNPGATVTINLPAATELGFYLIPNDTPDAFLANPDAFYGPLAFRPAPLFSRPAANPGQLDQMLASIGNGSSLFNFEDLTRIPGGGSDGDFDDIKFSIDEELIPVPLPPGEAEVVYGPGRSEDAIIAFSFDQFMATGDETWPALLPMVKSAVRAMDVIQEVVPLGLGVEINHFVVGGGSKRGWTTWLTAAVDALAPEPRVKAIIPAVIDVLNFNAQLDHHQQYYEGVTDLIVDGFSWTLQDYTALDVIERRNTPEGQALAAIVDPYVYRDRLTLPKFIVNSTGDEFFVPDSSQFYLSDLPGQTYLRYVPNTGHNVLDGSDAGESILAFYQAILNDAPLPEFSWTVEDNGATIRVTSVDAPLQVNLWQATNYASRDFRRSVTGISWDSSPLVDQGAGVYVARMDQPNLGATAFMVELVFASGGLVPFKFTTQVSVLSAVVAPPPIGPPLVPFLLQDINAATLSSDIFELTDVNGTLFFTTHDTAAGRELWKSDGTAEGTVLVKDIVLGSGGSYPSSLTNVNGTLFFAADGPGIGRELWKSDGTAEGTVLVADIRPGSSYGYYFGTRPYYLTQVGGALFFTADDGTHGRELWTSDGTAEGTMLVADIRPGSSYGYNYSSRPYELTDVNGTLFFTAYDGMHGRELWKSDGTTDGTMLVADIRPATPYSINQGSYPSELTDVGGTLFFTADDGLHGRELWKSDGTAEGTVLVANIRPDSPYGFGIGAYPASLTNVGGTLYFTADDGASGRELWKSDGMAGGTVLVEDIRPGNSYGYNFTSRPYELTEVNGTLFFTADDGVHGRELWTSDGTVDGTMLFVDIWPASPYGYNSGSYPAELTSVGGALFFSAADGVNGHELWKSDGTVPGTALVKDIGPDGLSGYPSLLTGVGGTLFFLADDRAHGRELWKSDGATASTMLVKDINLSTPGSYPQQLAAVNGTLFFHAEDGEHGRELWKSDGDSAALVADIFPGINNGFPQQLTPVNGMLFFTADDGVHGRELWKSDGTAEGTMLVADIRPEISYGYAFGSRPYYLTNVNGTLYFTADDGIHGRELWKSDGTAEGTVLVEDIRPGSSYGYNFSSQPINLTAVDGTLFFSANDGVHGRELWKSDGATEGAMLVEDIRPENSYGYNPSSQPERLTAVGGTLFFTADDGVHGRELWKSDGTVEGTMLVADIRPTSSYGYAFSSRPYYLTNVGGTLFFTAYVEGRGRELWKSDGTTDGTIPLKDVVPGGGGSYPTNLTDVNGTLFFTPYHSSIGRELWKSDGTSGGTAPVTNIYPGQGGAYPSLLTAVNGMLFFTAENGSGREIWQSDGSPQGTLTAADLSPGSSNPTELRGVDGTLFFTTFTNGSGVEPWRLVLPSAKDDGEWGYRELGIWHDGGSQANSMPGDANGDLRVDIFDVNMISDHWGWSADSNGAAPTCNADVNHDGVVDMFDVNLVSSHWGLAGAFDQVEPDPGWNADHRYQEPGSGDRTATWTIQAAPGEFEIFVTWVAGVEHATNATYTVLDGDRVVGQLAHNQQALPDGVLYNGRAWASLGRYSFMTGVVSVVLSDEANGRVVADAILVAGASTAATLRTPSQAAEATETAAADSSSVLSASSPLASGRFEAAAVDSAILPGDVNQDGTVNGSDVELVAAHWGNTGPAGDANADGVVDIFDVNWVSANWTEAAEDSFAAAAPIRTATVMADGQSEFKQTQVRMADVHRRVHTREGIVALGEIPMADAIGIPVGSGAAMTRLSVYATVAPYGRLAAEPRSVAIHATAINEFDTEPTGRFSTADPTWWHEDRRDARWRSSLASASDSIFSRHDLDGVLDGAWVDFPAPLNQPPGDYVQGRRWVRA